jgi:hypothetical protein
MLEGYAKIKAQRSALAKMLREKDSELKSKLALIESGLLKMMNDTGSDQLKVKGVGMAFRSERLLASGKDWQALWDHIRETGEYDLVQKRLAVGAITDYMENNDGDTPPGVAVTIERGVSVRRDN